MKKIKEIKKENLIIRNSFQLAYSDSEIWCEELDGLNVYKDVVTDKFLKDMQIIRRPSSPSLIAVHLNETLVEEDLVNLIVTEFKNAGDSARKIAFIGLNRFAEKLMKSVMKAQNVSFVYAFFKDYEKAKQWLVNSKK